tara:strand:+ start:165 stop:473 length:309 start_codon:yes stop_codon:yes gene_type:complete
MNDFNVDDARRNSGFDSLTGANVERKALGAIERTSNGKDDNTIKTSTSVEFKRFQLMKYSIKEGREALENRGFKVDVSEQKGNVKLHISWFFDFDKNKKLIL